MNKNKNIKNINASELKKIAGGMVINVPFSLEAKGDVRVLDNSTLNVKANLDNKLEILSVKK